MTGLARLVTVMSVVEVAATAVRMVGVPLVAGAAVVAVRMVGVPLVAGAAVMAVQMAGVPLGAGAAVMAGVAVTAADTTAVVPMASFAVIFSMRTVGCARTLRRWRRRFGGATSLWTRRRKPSFTLSGSLSA